jgi:aryl-alcohol dehydrogenase-like predicted oxidoreductase
MNLALGTVQFGMNYGVTNTQGQVTRSAVAEIMAGARDGGITWLDTAAAYGESEAVLGAFQDQFPHFRICTKTLPITSDRIDSAAVNAVREGFERSRQRLRRPHVELLMVHHAGNLLLPGADLLYDLLCHFKSDGLTKAIGFSAYAPEEVDAVIARYAFDAVQMPCNVLDQRLLTSELEGRLQAHGMALFVRSVFLQGVLLADAPRFTSHPAVMKMRDFARDHRLSPLQLALGFVRQLGFAQAVVGVTSARELTEIMDALAAAPDLDFAQLASHDADLIDPRRWH